MLGALIGDIDDIRAGYDFDVSCQGSVPQALEAFFESTGFEDAIRNAISIGGDSDTIAAITGGIAEAYYGIPDEIRKNALTFLDNYQLQILNAFEEKYGLTVEKATGNDISRPVAFKPERKKEVTDEKTVAFDMRFWRTQNGSSRRTWQPMNSPPRSWKQRSSTKSWQRPKRPKPTNRRADPWMHSWSGSIF